MKEEHKKEIGDNTTDGTPIKVSMGEFDFTKHQITYWSNGKKFILQNKQVSAVINNHRADFENNKVTILLDYKNGRFKFVESGILQSLIQTCQNKEKERDIPILFYITYRRDQQVFLNKLYRIAHEHNKQKI